MGKIQKKSDNSKYNRINLIYERLSNTTEGLTITELANELDVSTKTIQRDLYEVLVDFGAVKDGRKWKIDSKKVADNLNINERIVLGILDELAKNSGASFYRKAHSLLAQISQQLEYPIHTSIQCETLENSDMELFEKLEKSIKMKNQIQFTYQKYPFKVKPLKLVFFDGFWYLLAFDSKANDKFKKFHLKSIKNIKQLEKKFSVPSIVEDRLKYASSIWFNLDELISVRLFIDKDIRKYFERKPLPSQMIVGKDPDGSIEIEIKITNEMEIIPLIFTYLPYIKVLHPEWLAGEIKSRVTTYLEEIS